MNSSPRYIVNIPRRVEISLYGSRKDGTQLDILLFNRWNVLVIFGVSFYRFRREN